MSKWKLGKAKNKNKDKIKQKLVQKGMPPLNDKAVTGTLHIPRFHYNTPIYDSATF